LVLFSLLATIVKADVGAVPDRVTPRETRLVATAPITAAFTPEPT
jgi:hypothetical protein